MGVRSKLGELILLSSNFYTCIVALEAIKYLG